MLVAVNKADNDRRELEAAEFYALGWEETYPISAAHGRGIGDLLDAIVWALPPESDAELARKAREAEADQWARDVADGFVEPYVVGAEGADDADEADGEAGADGDGIGIDRDAAPGSGTRRSPPRPRSRRSRSRSSAARTSASRACSTRSSARSGSIVSDIPGTTRDAIDTTLAYGRSEIVLIDTAGIRRRGKVASGPAAERYSTLRALKAIARADVAILVLDAVDGLTAQDAHVAGYVVDEGKGLVVAINKWDLLAEKTDRTLRRVRRAASGARSRSSTSRRSSRSAPRPASGSGACSRPRSTSGASGASGSRPASSTGSLGEAVRRQVPPLVKGKRPKIFYATQAAVAPPTFVVFARDAGSVHFSYRRYLENQLREAYGFDGTPIRLVFRERSAVELPRRRRAGAAGSRAGTPRAV